jgi:hypothetical protein
MLKIDIFLGQCYKGIESDGKKESSAPLKNKLKTIGKTLALAAAFTAVAAPAFAQSEQPEPAKTYASLLQTVDRLGDQSKQIEMTVHTQDVLGLPTNTPEIAQLRQQLKKEISREAPRIVLAPGLSGPNVQSLINRFQAKVGELPDYLAKIDGQARFVPVCQSQLVTPEDARDIATARSVADCVAAKQGAEDKTAATPEQAPPPVQQAQPQQALPQQKLPPQKLPQQTQPAPPAPVEQPAAQQPSLLDKIHLKDIGAKEAAIGGGIGIVALGGIFAFRRARRKPIDAYVAVNPTPPETPPAPEAPVEKEPFKIRLKGNEPAVTKDDTPYKPPKKFSI